ncbi:putative FMN-dependent luciferase-like monooxygenase [Klebsiella pneumoniae]|nr:putative FMN-dependent luciferase-like monooxygenase [Klebsiella pneumoniae]
MPKRLGFFTRLLDQGSAQTRYRLAAEQIRHAERLGFDSAWIAQHHFHEQEGGLPSPLVFLAHVAAQTDRIRLGTAIITLPMENPLRVAEDAAVLDLLTDGRLEVGFGSGGTPTSFLPFGLTSEQRGAVFADHLHLIHSAWRGDTLSHPDNRLYPPAPQLAERIWIATFSAEGAIRAGQAGHGLMLSRTQPRPPGEPRLPLDAIQNPIIDAYLAALPDGVAPRILASRTAFVADSHAQGSYEVLFRQQDADFPLDERFAVAAKVAKLHQADALAAHYAGFGLADPTTDRLVPALAFARLLTFTPVEATPGALHTLTSAGWSLRGIVTLAQLVAFVSFQSRLLLGLRALNHKPIVSADTPLVAGYWHTTPYAQSGKAAPVRFTRDELHWKPWLADKPLAEFNAEEQAILAKYGHSDSPYFRLLARNQPVLEQRTLTDKGIFYTAGGLPRAERELAATVASKINGCIYCASVHARKAAQLAKDETAVDTLLAVTPGEDLRDGQSPRWQAEIDAAAALSVTPPALNADHLAALDEQGLDTLAQLDLLQSAAFFAWANRLMLTLGEPWRE